MVFRRTMPLSSKIFAVLAVILGTAAFLVVRAERERYAALQPAVGPPVTVVVTLAALPRGSVLTEATLETKQVPEAFAQPAALSSVEAAVGRVLAADVTAGEQLTRTRLVSPDAGALAGLVPEGMRAMALGVPIPAGLAAGDRIDVLATYGAEGRVYTETVGVGLEVLKVVAPAGAGLGAPSGGQSSTLILLATPDVTERLATAVAFGAVQVTVVGPDQGGALPTAAPVSG